MCDLAAQAPLVWSSYDFWVGVDSQISLYISTELIFCVCSLMSRSPPMMGIKTWHYKLQWGHN